MGRPGNLDPGGLVHRSTQSAMTLHEKLIQLRQQVKRELPSATEPFLSADRDFINIL